MSSSRGFAARLRSGDRAAVLLSAGFGVAAAVLMVWTSGMAVLSPQQNRVWDRATVVWVGFDAAMAVALGAAAVLAARRDARLPLVSAVLAVMLAVDAWFDVATSGHAEFARALALAMVVEMPLAAVCAVLAVRGQRELVRPRPAR